jgi:H+/Cl- antiporter ClcA
MKCCALCGSVKLNHHNQHFKKRKNLYNNAISPIVGCTVYGIANYIMAKYITNENGTLMFICKKCDKNKYSAYKTSFIIIHFPN